MAKNHYCCPPHGVKDATVDKVRPPTNSGITAMLYYHTTPNTHECIFHIHNPLHSLVSQVVDTLPPDNLDAKADDNLEDVISLRVRISLVT